MNKCNHCNREINNKGSLAAHKKHCHQNPQRIPKIISKKAGAKKGSIPWNYGLKNDIRCKHSESTKEKFKNNTGKAKTKDLEIERINKITEKAKIKNGGYRERSGRGKKGWYKNIYCDSSWELAFVIYHIDNNISITRCKEIRTYEFENSIKKYHPDFVVNNIIYEIKGYYSNQSIAKANQNPDIIVLDKDKIKFYLDYVINKYGKDFIRLYE